MIDPHAKIASLLRTNSKVIIDLERKMEGLTGKKGIIEHIADENEILVNKTLQEFGLTRDSSSEDIYHALLENLIFFDGQLFELLGRPNLFEERGAQVLINKGVEVANHNKGLFLKKDKAIEMLQAVPPENILKIFKYKNVDDLLKNESLEEIYSSLRFLESMKWMNEKFIKNYKTLTINDFEEREVKVIILHNKWVEAAEKFMNKKHHNLSHLKELGIIFIVPIKLGTQGETTRLFTLLLHYLNEVPFYSSLFKKYGQDDDFSAKLISLLRGDVGEDPLPDGDKITWRIVQRYLAKDNKDDFRLMEPHVNPEAEHWYKAEANLTSLTVEEHRGRTFGYWQGMDFVGDIFNSKNDGEKLISFDLIDIVMSLVKKEGGTKYLYHQQESLWNKIFIEYLGRDKMNELINNNIIKGYIEL